jgi:HTH-type transcriptional regulator, competence development regulator
VIPARIQIRGASIQFRNDDTMPTWLHALADIYRIDYGQLMEMTGYITQSKTRKQGERHGRLATFAEHHLTPAEEAELMDYLKFIRNRNKASDTSR